MSLLETLFEKLRSEVSAKSRAKKNVYACVFAMITKNDLRILGNAIMLYVSVRDTIREA